MVSRRALLAGGLFFGLVQTASAFEFKDYESAAVAKAIASGKPVVVHVYAPWCLQCRAQASILQRLSAEKTYDKLSFYRVAYDGQPDIVKSLNVPRSTLITYKGGKEVTRVSWGTSDEFVIDALKTVM